MCRFKIFPEPVLQLRKLRSLSFTGNGLRYLPKEIEENLEKGEELIKIVATFSIKNTPEFLALTNHRVIYLGKKRLGDTIL